MDRTTIELVLERVIRTEHCWFWDGGHNSHGRPYFRNQLVYRILYTHFRGEIPPGKVLDHIICDNEWCVNPYHVEPRTQAQNLARAGVTRNLGIYVEKGNSLSIKNLGDHAEIGKYRERDTLGRFLGG